ncbi:RmlC-like cupin domain-containing protein [Hypoxylon sp. FL1857]|nr:RmlC-like cupin domain-containing protein [Hypoxylon sp. FL1857]
MAIFSEDSTFLLSDFTAHTLRSVLAKNFRLAPEVFENIPAKGRYIFARSKPNDDLEKGKPDGEGIQWRKHQFTHKMLAQEPIRAPAGEVKITDTSNFPLLKTVSAAHVTIKPGGIREMHWHTQYPTVYQEGIKELRMELSLETRRASYMYMHGVLKSEVRNLYFVCNDQAQTSFYQHPFPE